MKIEFGTIIKPSIDSLNSKIKPVSTKYMVVIRGSQIILRARLSLKPVEAEVINALLDIKDLDAQLEPVSDEIDNKEAFTEVTKLMQATLTKGKGKEKDTQTEAPASEYYAHLPISGVKKGKQNMLDVSVQRYKVEACMNIDQKVDASGNILFLNKQHQHDFEVTYLQDNLIMFYQMDTMDLNQYPAQNKMAFRLKKCLSPEVQKFNTLLDEPSAQCVKKLIEDPKLNYAKSKIMRMLEKHYGKDPAQAELEIRNLYQASIQHACDVAQQEINNLSKIAMQQEKVVAEMIAYIEAHSEQKHEFRQRLSVITASSSSPTLTQVKTQLTSLETFKNELMPVYDATEREVLKQEAIQVLQPAPIAPPIQQQVTVVQPATNPKKKAKSKVKITSKEAANENLEDILNEAKNQYLTLTPIERFKILSNKHRPSLIALAVASNMPEHQVFGDRAAVLHSSLMLELINAAKTDKALEQAFFEFKDLYLEVINKVKADFKLKSDADHGDAQQYAAIVSIFDEFKNCLKKGDTYLRSIHEFMIIAYMSPQPILDPSQLKKAVSCVKNHRESFDAKNNLILNQAIGDGGKFALVIRSILNIVIDKKDAMNAFITLFMGAVSTDLKDLMEQSVNGKKTIDHVQSLLGLYCRGRIYQHFEINGDLIEVAFFTTLAKEVVEHKFMRDKIRDSFVGFFINKTVASLIMRRGDLPANHFKLMLAHAGAKVVSRIFPSNDFARNPLLVSKVLTHFSSLIPLLRAHYSILLIATPTISHEFEHSFQVNAPNSSIFTGDTKSSSGEIIQMITATLDAVSAARKKVDDPENAAAVRCYDITILCILLLIKTHEIVFSKQYKHEFSEMLKSSESFTLMAKQISDDRRGMYITQTPQADELFNAIADKISVVSDAIQVVDEADLQFISTADIATKYSSSPIKTSNETKNISIHKDAKQKDLSKIISPMMEAKHPQATTVSVDMIRGLIEKVNYLKNQLSLPDAPPFNPRIPQTRLIIKFITASQTNETVKEAFSYVNDFYRQCVQQYRQEAIATNTTIKNVDLNRVVRRRMLEDLPAPLKTDYTFHSIIMFMASLYLLPKCDVSDETLIKMKALYKVYRDSPTPSLASFVEGVMGYVFDKGLHVNEKPIESCRLLIYAVAMLDVIELINARIKSSDILMNIETGLDVASQCTEIQGFTKEHNPQSCHGLVNQLFLALIKNELARHNLCKLFFKHFIEKSIVELMALSSTAICAASTKSSVDLVIESVFQSNEYSGIPSLRESVLTLINPESLNTLFTILMLCTPTLSPTSNIPFICNVSIPSDSTPVETFRLGSYDKYTMNEHITQALAVIIDIRSQNESEDDKIKNINLEVVSMALELLFENVHLLYQKDFNQNFHKILCAHIDYLDIWELISSLHVLNKINEMGGSTKALYQVYRDELNKASAQGNTAVKTHKNKSKYKI